MQDNNNIEPENLDIPEDKKEDSSLFPESSSMEKSKKKDVSDEGITIKPISPESITSAEPEEEIKEKPSEETSPEETNVIPVPSKDSNYQVSLINENLLRIRVSTVKSVSIDCSVKDKSATGKQSSESQTNKILIHPKPDNKPQEVEIIISIDSDGNIVVEKKKIIS